MKTAQVSNVLVLEMISQEKAHVLLEDLKVNSIIDDAKHVFCVRDDDIRYRFDLKNITYRIEGNLLYIEGISKTYEPEFVSDLFRQLHKRGCRSGANVNKFFLKYRDAEQLCFRNFIQPISDEILTKKVLANSIDFDGKAPETDEGKKAFDIAFKKEKNSIWGFEITDKTYLDNLNGDLNAVDKLLEQAATGYETNHTHYLQISHGNIVDSDTWFFKE